MRGDAQVQAFYALNATGEKPGDLDLLLEAAADPSPAMRESASHLLMLYTDGKIIGEAAEVVLELLETDSRDTLREVMRGLWGAQVSPEVETRLLEIARTRPRSRHDAIYFALSTLQGKSTAVVEELISSIDQNDRSAGRAMWGLNHGVAPENHEQVADFMLKVFEARSSFSTRKDCLRGLERYAGPEHLGGLEAIATNELVNPELRERARKIIERIRR
jgi:hypothetical protein